MVPDPHAITPRVFDLLVLLDSPMFILDLYDQIKATTPGGTFHLDLLPRIDDWQSFRSSSKECTHVCLIHHLFSAEKLNGHRVEYELPKFLGRRPWNQRRCEQRNMAVLAIRRGHPFSWRREYESQAIRGIGTVFRNWAGEQSGS